MFKTNEADPELYPLVGNAGIPPNSVYKATVCFPISDAGFVDIRITKEQLTRLIASAELVLKMIEIDEEREATFARELREAIEFTKQNPIDANWERFNLSQE